MVLTKPRDKIIGFPDREKIFLGTKSDKRLTDISHMDAAVSIKGRFSS